MQDIVQKWQHYLMLLIKTHGKVYAMGVLLGMLIRLSRQDAGLRVELDKRIRRLED